MSVKPKQLVFDDDEDCDLNDTFTTARTANTAEERERTWFRGKKDGSIEERFSLMVAQKLHIPRQKSCDSYSEGFDYEEFSELEVEGPEQVEESVVDILETQEVASGVSESIVAKVREEIEI
ncbi:hypothetical protein GIB67_032596 [Kingdonia uniflora]|uniref:Uncharacterized protein n=1 Tax=Kingdonia uniflora TaxID=39325 RepID=A0A7J7NXQ6_9MAGN|nr:hypothetical protein GIB67_032596 [Kingdonia uniflora]